MFKIKFVYGFLPALVFYVDKLKSGFAGFTNAFVVRILKSKINDRSILEHELTHVKQWYRTLGLHGILYLVSKKYRYRAELEAYRHQLKFVKNKYLSADRFASYISRKYNLNVPKSKALIDLLKD